MNDKSVIAINFDSGACESVLPEKYKQRQLITGLNMIAPRKYYTASGEEVVSNQTGNLNGEVIANGRTICMRGRIAGVKKPLLSATECMEKTNSLCVMGAKAGILIQRNSALGQRLEWAIAREIEKESESSLAASSIPLQAEAGVMNIYVRASKTEDASSASISQFDGQEGQPFQARTGRA